MSQELIITSSISLWVTGDKNIEVELYFLGNPQQIFVIVVFSLLCYLQHLQNIH